MERGFIAARWEDWEMSNEKLHDDEFHDSGNGSSPEESLVSKTNELHLQPISRSHIRLYHHVPEFDRFHSVRCSLCGKVIKVQSFILHCAKRHGYPMGTIPADVMPQRTLMKAADSDNLMDTFLLSPPPPLADVLKDAQFEPVVDNDSNSFKFSSLECDREASNCSSATEEQIPVSGEVPLPGEEFEQCFLSPPAPKLEEDNLPHDFLMTTGPEDINKNNYFNSNKSANVSSSSVDAIEAPILDTEESLVSIEPVETKVLLCDDDEPQIQQAQFPSVDHGTKPEVVEIPLHQPNQFFATVESFDEGIPILEPQFVDSEEGLPDDLKNINIKQEFGCPEMTKLLEPDVNLDAICKSEILDDMLILPQVAFDEASKISNPGMPNAVVTPVINNTPEKTPAKTRKTRSRSQVFDPDRHCGVPFMKNGQMVTCMRAVTCKAHSLSSRREVPGRSKPLSVLMQILKAEKLAKKEEKERELMPNTVALGDPNSVSSGPPGLQAPMLTSPSINTSPLNGLKIEPLDPNSFLEPSELFPQTNILLPNVLNYETSGLVNEPFHVEEPVKSEAVATLAEEEQNVAESSDLSECFSKPFSCLFGAGKITSAYAPKDGAPCLLTFDRGAVNMRRLFSNLLGLSPPPSAKMSKQSENLASFLAKCASKTKRGRTNGACNFGAARDSKSQNALKAAEMRLNSKSNQRSRILGVSNISGANLDLQGNLCTPSSCSENLLTGLVKPTDPDKKHARNFASEDTLAPVRNSSDSHPETDRFAETGSQNIGDFSPSCNFPSGGGMSANPAMARLSSGMTTNFKANVPQDLILKGNVPVNQYPSPTNQISPFAPSPMALTSPKTLRSPTPNSDMFMKKCELMGYGNANSSSSNTRKRKVSAGNQPMVAPSSTIVSPIPAKIPAPTVPAQHHQQPQQQHLVYHPGPLRPQHVALSPAHSPSVGHSPRQKFVQQVATPQDHQNFASPVAAQMMSPSPIGYPPTPSPNLPPSPVKQNQQHLLQQQQSPYQASPIPQKVPPNGGYMMSPSSAAAPKPPQHYLSPEKQHQQQPIESQCSPVRQYQLPNQVGVANDVSELGAEMHVSNPQNPVYCSSAEPPINLGTDMSTPIITTQRFFPSAQYRALPPKSPMVPPPSQHYMKQSPLNQANLDPSIRSHQMMPHTSDAVPGSYPMTSQEVGNPVYSGGVVTSGGHMSGMGLQTPVSSCRQSVIHTSPIRGAYRPTSAAATHHQVPCRYIMPPGSQVAPSPQQQMLATGGGGLLVPRVAGAGPGKYLIAANPPPPNSAHLHSAAAAYHPSAPPGHPMQPGPGLHPPHHMGKRYFMRAAGPVTGATAIRVHPHSALHVNTRVISPNAVSAAAAAGPGGYFSNCSWRGPSSVASSYQHHQQLPPGGQGPVVSQMMPCPPPAPHPPSMNKAAVAPPPPHVLAQRQQQLPSYPSCVGASSSSAMGGRLSQHEQPQQPHFHSEHPTQSPPTHGSPHPHHAHTPSSVMVSAPQSTPPLSLSLSHMEQHHHHQQQASPSYSSRPPPQPPSQYYPSLDYLPPPTAEQLNMSNASATAVSCSYGDPNLPSESAHVIMD